MDEITASYYELRFRVLRIESNGEAFQDFFSTIMEMRYPGDFVRVRPWGNLGDRKNDGYLRSKRQLFQCYAPREIELAKTIAKINEDFHGALPHWKEYFDQWVFVHNDYQGLPADILKLLLELTDANAPLSAAPWGYAELFREFIQLSEANVARLLGPAPTRKDIVDVRLEEIKSLLQHIALQPEPLTADVRLVPADKLEYNQLSHGVATLLKAGMTRAEIVKKYLRGIADQTRYDRMAAAFRLRYKTFKDEGRAPDDIFAGFQKFVAGEDLPSPSYQAATLAILAFFFEACEIFERPPDLTGAA